MLLVYSMSFAFSECKFSAKLVIEAVNSARGLNFVKYCIYRMNFSFFNPLHNNALALFM